ncbi:MAG: glycoside hydrolase family 57 protein [Candidatus Auribacterota bacterium]|jgi:alpha-amylase/alpha-mannosidase (GH57 family)|nr:glycoside hydrolase family 57 protein [Candidatus Auribacterota bacterium]
MKELSLAFLWHMHQPYYKDTLSGTYHMPWVRMHALKGYFDMPSILEEYPCIHATFNIVPSLLQQLMDYVTQSAKDVFIDITLKSASDLTDDDKQFILSNFFMANWDTMIKPYPRYWQLLTSRGVGVVNEKDWPSIVRQFSAQDYRDLQMWFNLTWFGYRARKKYPHINELIKKGKQFSEHDKRDLIDLQYEVINQIIPLYKKLAQNGQIELTTTPMYHPILPLIYDTNFAYRSMPDAILPSRFQYPVDANDQIKRGVDYFETLFGFRPVGMWPSEGSVCPEIVPFFKEAGIQWIATDEEILKYSLGASHSRDDSLFQPYRFSYQDSNISVLFRDKGLSDVIGFTYAKNPPVQSVADFLNHLNKILHSTTIEKPLVGVFLDGENAWEYFSDGGEEFFRQLYTQLSNLKTIKTTRVSDYLANNQPKNQLSHLHSGSWINHDFKIWIADSEKNQAWNYLRQTREFVDTWFAKNPEASDELKQKVMSEIFMAEGSDWFWWYGEPFSTDNDEEFDRLFRLHLINVYRMLDSSIPAYLKNPIIVSHKTESIIEKPVGFIHPIIDGRKTHFYEWQEAGYYNTSKSTTTMHKSEIFLKTIFYGFDLQHLYLRFDPFHNESWNNKEKKTVAITINAAEKQFLIEFPFERNTKISYVLFVVEQNKKQQVGKYTSIKADKIIELSIPFEKLKLHPGYDVSFFAEIKHDDLSLEKYPNSGVISFSVPDAEFENTMWSV